MVLRYITLTLRAYAEGDVAPVRKTPDYDGYRRTLDDAELNGGRERRERRRACHKTVPDGSYYYLSTLVLIVLLTFRLVSCCVRDAPTWQNLFRCSLELRGSSEIQQSQFSQLTNSGC